MSTTNATSPTAAARLRRLSNGWPTVPLRIYLASVFLFAGYAKLTYPGFFDPRAVFGFKSAVDSAKQDSPLSGLMGPLSDHTSLFGHITAFSEIAIGLGLLVGLLTRLAALGGMVLAISIVLSINWAGVKEYTGNGGWFTSVDLAVTAALSVFLIGGAGPLSLDAAIVALRDRRRAKEDAEPSYSDYDADIEDSRRRLRGDDQSPAGTGQEFAPAAQPFGTGSQSTDQQPGNPTEKLPGIPTEQPGTPAASPAADPNSLWNQPRREQDH
jgi:thiosulfate dehydrogenase (quinone) large subunit